MLGRFGIALGLVGAVLLSPAALGGESVTSKGEGVYREDDERREIVEVTVKPREKGRILIIMTFEDGGSLKLAGPLHGSGLHRTIAIDRGLDRKDKTNGEGDITLENNSGRIRELRASGETGRHRFDVRFHASDEDRHHRHHGDHDDHWRGDSYRDHGHYQDYDDRNDHERRGDRDDRFSFSDNSRGEGTMRVGDDDSQVRSVRVHMSRNGDLTIEADGRHMDEVEWHGRWRGSGPEYRIELHDASEDFRIHADGTIKLSRDGTRLKRITLEGERGRRSFAFDFKSESHDEDDRGDHDDHQGRDMSFSDNPRGEGTYRIGDDEGEVRTVRVHMSRDGSLKIKAEGRSMDDVKWRGTWRGSGQHVQFELTGVSGADQFHAEGTLKLSKDGTRLKKVRFDGHQGRRPVSFDFKAERWDVDD